MNLVMVLGMLVFVSLSISMCMLIVSNALSISNATVMVRFGGSFFIETCCNCIVDAV